MRVSVTERQTYKRCRRKWDYSSYNRMSLAPVVNAPALDLGTLIHKVLADWTAEPTMDPVARYTQVVQEYFQQLIQLYTEKVGCAPSKEELGPHLQAIALGQDMIKNYQTKWHTPLPPGFTLIENELALVQPVPGTEHYICAKTDDRNFWCICDGLCCSYDTPSCDRALCEDCSQTLVHELECTFDGLMADENGDYYIIERKTFARTPSTEELNSNDQFLAYQWAANQVWPGKVVGVAYDGLLKKPAPSGVHKDLSSLFLRKILLRPQAELDEFGQLLSLELNEMASPNLPIYKTVPWMGCQRWECSFLDLCHATSRGEPTESLLKMFVRSERKKHLDLVEAEAPA